MDGRLTLGPVRVFYVDSVAALLDDLKASLNISETGAAGKETRSVELGPSVSDRHLSTVGGFNEVKCICECD